jgi:hypothetical protein
MAFAANHVLLGIHGVFGSAYTSPLERWTTTLRVQPAPATAQDIALINFLADCEPFITAHHTTSDTKVGAGCWLTELTAAVIGQDGKYLGGETQETTRVFLTTPVQGSGTGIHPFPTSIVRSLRTARGRGRASNGRMYYPALAAAVTVAQGGRMSVSDAGGIAAFAASLLNGINTSATENLGVGSGVSVMSSVGLGLSASVISVRVGTRLDHMESRERALPEAWQSVDLA